MMAVLVAAGLRHWDYRWLYLKWAERAVYLAVLAAFLSATEHGISNPTGGQVVSGSAAIGTTAPNTLQVDQHTKVVIINWSSFNIANGETTKFNQPDAGALAVSRIGGNSPSQILGNLSANGRIILINGDGIVFGPNARIDVGSLLATTSDARNEDIASGKATFDKAGRPNAMILNQGTIRADGMVGLIAPAVRNDGVIAARLGSVTLGASNVFTLDFTGDGLISFPLDANVVSRAIDANGKPVEALVVNNGKITGSTVLLTARAASNLVANVISTGGTIAATSVHRDGGDIVLDAGEGGVAISGTITAIGRSGGTITVTGGDIALKGATLDASGEQGGGSIKLGAAGSAAVDAASRLSASATTNGSGGSISVIAGSTQFAGQADARGVSGNGGAVETSGHSLDIAGARIDTSAVSGIVGSWLLDPDDYTIGGAEAATIAANLATGNVTVQTTLAGSGGNGDIFVNAPVSWASANSLTLSAYRNIAINANVTNTGGAGVLLYANNTGTGTGAVNYAGGAAISTSGVVRTITTITYAVDDSSSVYGTLATLGTATLTGVLAGDTGDVTPVVSLFNSSNSAVTLSAALNAGSYSERVTSLTGFAANSYTIAASGNTDGILIVNPAPLIVAANAASRIYGSADPALTYSSSGFVNGDSAALFTGALGRAAGSNVGSYAIGLNTLSAGGNYTIAYTGADLSITPATLNVTATAGLSKVYGSADPALTYSHGALVNGDNDTVFSGALSRASGSNVGSYAISQNTLSAGSNYTIA